MATITGGSARTPRGTLSWRPAAPVAKAYEFLTRNASDAYRCLGVIGNWSHLSSSNPGDHTPYSSHDTWVGGRHYVPKRGWVYAIDLLVPGAATFERWFLSRLRAGVYPQVKYWNISHRHWNRRVVKAGKPFAASSYSGDSHLHISFMPGAEYAVIDVLGDYERYRSTGKNTPVVKPATRPTESTPVTPAARPVDEAAAKLAVLKQGASGVSVKVLQAFLVAREMWPRNNASVRAHCDGEFGAGTTTAVRAFQKKVGLPVTGVVNAATWRLLAPDKPDTVIRGTDGYYAWLMQCLLLVRGFNPGTIDGDAGDNTIAALKRFQQVRKVRNSVVAGHGDGVGGTNTWVALLTI